MIIMANERTTENLVLEEMKVRIGDNESCVVFSQGDTSNLDKVHYILKNIGGKPVQKSIEDFSIDTKGASKPEFIISLKTDQRTIIVIECKKSVKFHQSDLLDKPKSYSVDGLLYYVKHLKFEYNVIAIAVSGTSKENIKVSTYYWAQNAPEYIEFKKAKDILLEPENYLKLINGDKIQKQYSIDDIRETALMMHEALREIKVSERYKPIFIAGILIALQDEAFIRDYVHLTSVGSVISNLKSAISNVLNDSDIKKDKIENIKNAFNIIGSNEKLKLIPLGQKNSITWYIEILEMRIYPMMNYADSTLDALGVFYHEFVKYSGGDGKGLGIVLTPQHLTEFMCDLADVNKSSRVVDICCGSGSFLVTSMSKMIKEANAQEITNIKKHQLYGVELDPDLFTLAIANMIIRRDGKSNIIHGDCFNKDIIKNLKSLNLTVGLINPPYSQKDNVELRFVENMLDILSPRGIGVVVVPMSCAIGTKFKDVRERLFKKHSLKAVFSMPDDIFYPTGTNVCVMVWEAHKKHDSSIDTFFGYTKDDGFIKRKKLGRVDVNNRWKDIKNEWISLYNSLTSIPGKSALKKVKHSDEWLVEAYMETDYSIIQQSDFQQTIKDYLAYIVRSGD